MTGRARLPAIQGMVPHPLARPSGCTFRTRCRHVIQGICDLREPALKPCGDGEVACFLQSEETANV